MSSTHSGSLSLVLLAGERHHADPLTIAHNVPSKVLVPVGGEPIVLRVMRALADTAFDERIIVGPAPETVAAAPALKARIEAESWRWLAPAGSPAASVAAALDAIESPGPVLVTTADHGLLSPALVHEFCTAAQRERAALVIGFVRHADVMAAFPDGRRTGWGFADDRYCGCNMFYFARPEAKAVATLWREVESERKRPWKVVGLLGAGALLKFLVRRLTLGEALQRLGKRVGVEIGPVFLSDPRAAVDVDTLDDWRLVDAAIRSD